MREPRVRSARAGLTLAFVLLAASCSGTAGSAEPAAPPPAADAPLADDERAIVDGAVADVASKLREPLESFTLHRVLRLSEITDERLGWVVSDLMQFVFRGEPNEVLIATAERLSATDLPTIDQRKPFTDVLIDRDVPAPPGYEEWKRQLFTSLEPAWTPFFEDPEADVDWRLVSFGGVLADTRPYGDGGPCQCIPALDEPAAVPAAEADFMPIDGVVFGVVHNGEARAYARHMLELHELVNDRLGGEPFSLVYCTLCGTAQGFLSDGLVLRTSGLLSRSNKMMFDLTTGSLYDTFAGLAVTGPRRGEVIEQIAVVTSSWRAWQEAHPDTTIMVGDPGIDYPLDPLGDRDAGGPIFPIGSVDDREAAQRLVVGVLTEDGRALAFPAQAAREALRAGERVELAGVALTLDGDGLRATIDGEPVVSHEAYWFAWSQRHPDTERWGE